MPAAKAIDPALVAQIVRSYVAHHSIAAAELPNLIATVHRSLAGLDTSDEIPTREPAVAINRSYGRDFVICLDCGWRGQMLRRHLTTAHDLSPVDYRTRWNLKSTHPITAPAYSERRTAMAKQIGLGHNRQPAQSETKRRGRPRRTAPTTTP